MIEGLAGDGAAPAGDADPVGVLEAAVEMLRGRWHPDLPGELALAETGRLLLAVERLRAVSLSWLADVHTRGLHELAGAPTTSSWVGAQQVGVDGAAIALAKRLSAVPAVHRAVLDGRCSLRAAEAVAVALDKLRGRLDRPDGLIDNQSAEAAVHNMITCGVLMALAQGAGGYRDDDPQLVALRTELTALAARPTCQRERVEAAFVLLAEHLAPGLLRDELGRLVDALLPQQLTDRCENAHAQRAFKMIRSYDGTGWQVSRGQLDAECGELLFTVLAAARATDPDNPADTAAWASRRRIDAGVPADDPDVEPRAPRSKVQRDHDALALGLRALLDSGALGTRGKAVPHLLITVPLAALNNEPGAPPAVAASGASIPAPLARRWLCDSQLTRLVLSLGGHRDQPHPADPQSPRTTRPARPMGRPVRRRRLPQPTRHPTRPAPPAQLGIDGDHQLHRQHPGLPPHPPPPTPRPQDHPATRRPIPLRRRLDRQAKRMSVSSAVRDRTRTHRACPGPRPARRPPARTDRPRQGPGNPTSRSGCGSGEGGLPGGAAAATPGCRATGPEVRRPRRTSLVRRRFEGAA